MMEQLFAKSLAEASGFRDLAPTSLSFFWWLEWSWLWQRVGLAAAITAAMQQMEATSC